MATQVYFATNRNPIESPVENNFGTDFSPDGSVSFGRATVNSVKDESELGNSNLSIDAISTGGFQTPLRNEIVNNPSRHLLVYFHGFDYRFREVLMRAAFVGDWLSRGKPSVRPTLLAFSWPSLGSLTPDAYRTDYRSASLSGGAFHGFLKAILPILVDYKKGGSGRRVTFMAHSLGNHFLRCGLAAAVGSDTGKIPAADLKAVIDQVVLAASDDDVDTLSRPDGLGIALSICEKVHLYYNQQDIPLNTVSRIVNGISRLGVAGPPDKPSFAGRNISFINCSAANPFVDKKKQIRLDPQWHQYYRLVPEVRDDICGAIMGLDDSAMPNRVYRKKENYWRLNLA